MLKRYCEIVRLYNYHFLGKGCEFIENMVSLSCLSESDFLDILEGLHKADEHRELKKTCYAIVALSKFGLAGSKIEKHIKRKQERKKSWTLKKCLKS